MPSLLSIHLTLKFFYLATWDPSIALPGSQRTGLRFSYVTAKCVSCVYAGSLQTETAWLTRPVWLIGLFKGPVIRATCS